MRAAKLGSALIATMLVAFVLFAALPAQARTQQTSRLYWNTPDRMGEIVHGATARLTRTENAVRATLRTRGLEPGHAYTMWWIVFNDPENCVANPGHAFNPAGSCGLPDVFSPLTGASHIWGDGAVVGRDGKAVFSSRVRKGHPGELDGEPGLTNPQGAEYYLAVRDHGPAVKGSDQTRSLNGGCLPVPPGHGSVGTYNCENEQMAFFAAPK